MSREKNKYVNVLNVFCDGVSMYFKNLDTFLKYLAFPVLGQMVGVAIILVTVYYYTLNLPNLMREYPIFDNILGSLTFLLLCTLPGFFLFCKAFYDYLIAMASLNSMANNLSAKGKKKKVLDTTVHVEIIKRRSFNYFLLLFVLGVLYMVGMLPIFWVILGIFLVYSCLSLQVFALEESIGPVGAIKRSFALIKNNFWATTLLLLLVSAFTYMFLPNVITWAVDKANFIQFASFPVKKYLALLPVDQYNAFFKEYNIAYQIEIQEMSIACVGAIVSYIVTSFTLPIRCCCCTLWYKHLDAEKIEENRKAGQLDGRAELKKVMKKPKAKKES